MRPDRALALLLAFAAPLAAAQDYPTREIRSLCNYAPGSGADLIVRFYSDRLSKLAGRPVIVENRVGANGMIATDALAKSRPDGYTIMITPASSTIAAAPYLFKSLPFDTTKDFAAVATIASLSFVILVDAAGPIKSMGELVAHLKAKPTPSFYGATSNTGVIAAELFKTAAGVKTTYVPYKQNVQALTDLLLGQLDFIAFDATWALGQAKGGKLRILAATAAKRTAALPDVPTLAELGYPGVGTLQWLALFAPSGVPAEVIETLHKAAFAAANSPAVIDRLKVQVMRAVPTKSPAEAKAWLAEEMALWRKIVAEVKIDLPE